MRRYYHLTIEELRRDLERSEDTESTALNISQLIEQHGAHGWVDPLVEKAGPSILSQTQDLANFLEVLRKSVIHALDLSYASRNLPVLIHLAFTNGVIPGAPRFPSAF